MAFAVLRASQGDYQYRLEHSPLVPGGLECSTSLILGHLTRSERAASAPGQIPIRLDRVKLPEIFEIEPQSQAAGTSSTPFQRRAQL